MSCALASRWVETLWQSITAGTFYVSVSVIPSGKDPPFLMAIFNSNVKLPEGILWYVGEIFADSNDSTTQVKTSRYFNTNAQESDEWWWVSSWREHHLYTSYWQSCGRVRAPFLSTPRHAPLTFPSVKKIDATVVTVYIYTIYTSCCWGSWLNQTISWAIPFHRVQLGVPTPYFFIIRPLLG